MKPQRSRLLYKGKAKQVYQTEHPDRVIIEFKDSLTANDGLKKGSFRDKGQLCAQISAQLFKLLSVSGLATHLISEISETSLLCKKVQILPIEVVVRNTVAGFGSNNKSDCKGVDGRTHPSTPGETV